MSTSSHKVPVQDNQPQSGLLATGLSLLIPGGAPVSAGLQVADSMLTSYLESKVGVTSASDENKKQFAEIDIKLASIHTQLDDQKQTREKEHAETMAKLDKIKEGVDHLNDQTCGCNVCGVKCGVSCSVM